VIKFSKANLHNGLKLDITEAYSVQEDRVERLVCLENIFD